MIQQNCNELSRAIPLTGLEPEIHIILFGIIIPIIASIILSIIFAKYIGPLFLSLKRNLLYKKYTSGFIKREPNYKKPNTIVKRMILTTLLAFGLGGAILPLFDVDQLISPQIACSYIERGLNYEYHFDILFIIMGLVLPLAVALMSVSWALEDAGVMHYCLDKFGLYEIEPVHVKYSQFLKGYAGISSLMFALQFVSYQFENNSIEDAALIFAVLLVMSVSILIVYFVFITIMKEHEYLTKDLSEIKKITEDDLKTE